MATWNKLNLIGQIFGELKVIGEAESVKKPYGNLSYWLCECSCGATKTIAGRSLTSGNTKSCGHCRKLAHNWCGCGEITGSYWSHVKHNSQLRNKIFDLSIEEAWQVFIKQNRKCAISGVDLKFAKNYMKDMRSQTASLDRIDSGKDYVADNIQWVHKTVNKMKNTLPDNDLVEWCKIIYEYNKSDRIVHA